MALRRYCRKLKALDIYPYRKIRASNFNGGQLTHQAINFFLLAIVIPITPKCHFCEFLYFFNDKKSRPRCFSFYQMYHTVTDHLASAQKLPPCNHSSTTPQPSYQVLPSEVMCKPVFFTFSIFPQLFSELNFQIFAECKYYFF